MQPNTPPDRIRQAAAATGFVDDHTNALRNIAALHNASSAAEALTAGRTAATFLAAHMAEEEARDGVFHWLVALDASLGDEVERLLAEHSAVRVALSALLHAPEPRAVELAHHLADLLEEHEAAERRALDRAVRSR